MSTVAMAQVGDLKPGEWFDREGRPGTWMVLDAPVRPIRQMLCVRVLTGQLARIDSSEAVYPRPRPY